jgi:hypothetical protein
MGIDEKKKICSLHDSSYFFKFVHMMYQYLYIVRMIVVSEQPYISILIDAYFIALGVLLGGALIGGLSAFLTGKPMLTEIYRISTSIRIWAIIAAIGGTFDTVYSFEKGFLDGGTKDIFKQFLLILTAMGGAQTGATIINWLTQEHI